MRKIFLLLALLGMITVSCDEFTPDDNPGNIEQPDDDNGGNDDTDDDTDDGNGGDNGGDNGGGDNGGGDDDGSGGNDEDDAQFTINGSSAITVGAEGGSVEVKITTSVEYSIAIPSSVSWIRHTDTRASENQTLVFVVAKNESEDSRKANIRFVDADNVLLQTLTITQSGVKESTNVEDPVEDDSQSWD